MGAAAALALAAVAAALAACQVVRAPDPPPSAETPALVRLLEQLERDDLVLPEQEPRRATPLASTTVASPVGDGPLLQIALAPEEAVLVRARVRAADESALEARLLARPLEAAPTADGAPLAASEALEAPPGWLRPASVEAALDRERATAWQELELYVAPLARRAGLTIDARASGGALQVDRIDVEPVAEWQRPLVMKRAPDDRARAPWRRIVRLHGERRDALLLPAGASASWQVRVPERAPRLLLSLGACAPADDAPLRVAVTIDGARAATFDIDRSSGAPTPYRPARVALDELAGRDARLELAIEGAGGGVAVIGSPLLAGAPAGTAPPGLVLVSIDTLRADQLGCYGASPSVTPRLDRLAAEGTRFARVSAASSWTLPSHATVFTGHPPAAHGAIAPGLRVDGERTPLLAPLLARRGYVTAAFTGGGFLDPAFGFGPGFDVYDTRDPCQSAPEGVGASVARDPGAPLLEWLERHHDLPFFLFVHTYVVHNYAPTDACLERVAPDCDVKARESARLRVLFANGDATALPGLQALYAAALAQADELLVGRLLDRLDALGLADRTVVALVSDHGDQWREHGDAFHSRWLWRELTEVPWIVRGPGVPRGRVEEALVGHCDVAPTLLARLGLAFEEPIAGRDRLVPQDDENAVLSHVLATQDGDLHGLEIGPWKLLRRRPPAGEEEVLLFRRDLDPAERDDLAARHPRIVEALLARLELELEEAAARTGLRPSGEAAELDEPLEEQLRELGYLADD